MQSSSYSTEHRRCRRVRLFAALAASTLALFVPSCGGGGKADGGKADGGKADGGKSKGGEADGAVTPAAAVQAKWSRSGTLEYRYEGARPSTGPKSRETIAIAFSGGDDAEITGPGGAAKVTFAEDGTVVVKPVPDPDPRPALPPYLHMFRVGASAGKALAVGEAATLRIPADADIPATQLTVQSEVTMTLSKVGGDVAEFDFETNYRVIDNDALKAFKDDVSASGSGDARAIEDIIDGAKGFRLAGFGTVEFDVAKGHMISASYTGAGLPLDALDRASLSKRPEALAYTLTLQGS